MSCARNLVTFSLGHGLRLFGVIDRVPGQLHVATDFVHLWRLPLIPRQTYLVSERHDERYAIPRDSRSVRWAYLRTLLFLLGGALCVVAVFAARDARPFAAFAAAVAAAAAWLVIFVSASKTWPSEARAWELARLLEHRRKQE